MIQPSKRWHPLILAVAVPILAAPSIRACSLVGKIHGTVSDATVGGPIQYMTVECSLKNGGWNTSKDTDTAGKYKIEDLSPGDYTVSLMMCSGYIWPGTTDVALAAGEDVMVDFKLTRVAPNLGADQISVDPGPDPSTGCIGDGVAVRVRIQYQQFSFEPVEFWLWAWDAAANKAVIVADWDSTMIGQNLDSNSYTMVDTDTLTVTEDVIVPWWTNELQNGTFVLKSALKCSNTLDPNDPKYTGDPPPDEFTGDRGHLNASCWW